MAKAYVGQFKAVLTSTFDNGLDLSTVRDPFSLTIIQDIANGVGAAGAKKAQAHWHDQRTLLTATSEDLDLSALAGDAFGTANFSKVRYMAIRLVTETVGYKLELGASGGNEWAGAAQPLKAAGDILILGAGALLILTDPVDGYTVDGTHKLLHVNNPSGGSVVYDILIVGDGTVA